MNSQFYKYEVAQVAGPIIKQLRCEKHISQSYLAIMLNVSRSVVANWEAGLRAPTVEQFIRLSKYFNVSTEYLSGRADGEKFIRVFEKDYIDLSKLNETGQKVILELYKSMLSNPSFIADKN